MAKKDAGKITLRMPSKPFSETNPREIENRNEKISPPTFNMKKCTLPNVGRQVDEDHVEDTLENLIGEKEIIIPKKSSVLFRR